VDATLCLITLSLIQAVEPIAGAASLINASIRSIVSCLVGLLKFRMRWRTPASDRDPMSSATASVVPVKRRRPPSAVVAATGSLNQLAL